MIKIEEKLKKEISKKINFKKILKCTTGGAAGSILKIEMSDNCYFFIFCFWRIERNGIIVSTSEDCNTAVIGHLSVSAKKLDNLIIQFGEVNFQSDLFLKFNEGYVLKAFCSISSSNQFEDEEYGTNWELCLPNENLVFSVNNNFQISLEKYY